MTYLRIVELEGGGFVVQSSHLRIFWTWLDKDGDTYTWGTASARSRFCVIKTEEEAEAVLDMWILRKKRVKLGKVVRVIKTVKV